MTTCSDCRFYDERYTGASVGDCTIAFPPWMAVTARRNGDDFRLVDGYDTCDLGQPKETP